MRVPWGRFTSVDPLAEKYYSWSPYVYVMNNPLKYIDPTGMAHVDGKDSFNELRATDEERREQQNKEIEKFRIWERSLYKTTNESPTDYVSEAGYTLAKTKDGLSDIIIIFNPSRESFEKALNKLNNEGKMNDAEANKEYLHSLGEDIGAYKMSWKTEDSSLDAGYPMGYEVGYNKSRIWTTIWMHIQGVSDEGAKILSGYKMGVMEGEKDKRSGRLSRLDPYKGLKHNVPIIKLK